MENDQLVRRSCGDSGEIPAKNSLYDLAQILMWKSSGNPGEVLSTRSLHDLVQVLVRRSCGDPVEIPRKRSLRQDLPGALHWCLYEFFWDVHRKCLYEDLL